MPKHVGNDSIIFYHAVNYESTDEKEPGGGDTVAHKEGMPRDTDGSDEEVMFH
ncbi:hypothetical protein K3495_g14243 [Podosphaera aphanis]|nr:hypothetical protein K3495_g14243 [Podosphaera aphanis]